MYGVGYATDANTELQLSEQQQQASSWFTQAAASALSANVQKTVSSYLNFGFTMPNLGSIINSRRTSETQAAAASSTVQSETSSNQDSISTTNNTTSNNNNNKNDKANVADF